MNRAAHAGEPQFAIRRQAAGWLEIPVHLRRFDAAFAGIGEDRDWRLGVNDRTQAVIVAAQRGIVEI